MGCRKKSCAPAIPTRMRSPRPRRRWCASFAGRSSTGGCAIRAGSGRWPGSGRRLTTSCGGPAVTAPRSCSRRSRSCRSIPKRWLSSIAITGVWPKPVACRAIAGCRRSGPTGASSPPWPSWCAAPRARPRNRRRRWPERSRERCSCGGLPVAEGAAHHRGHRVDGGVIVPAAALRLSLRGAARLQPRADAGSHGAAAVARHHVAGGGDGLWVWGAAGGDTRGCRLAARLDLGQAGAGRAADGVPRFPRLLAARFRRRAVLAFGAILPFSQRVADARDDRDRALGGGEAVLSRALVDRLPAAATKPLVIVFDLHISIG